MFEWISSVHTIAFNELMYLGLKTQHMMFTKMTTLKAKHNKSNQNIFNVYYTAVLRGILNQWDCTVGGAIQRNKMSCSLRLDKTLCKGAFMVTAIIVIWANKSDNNHWWCDVGVYFM